MRKSFIKPLLLTTSLFCVGGGAAFAQDGGTESEEVVVTGSRVVSNGNAAPTPLTVLTTEDLTATTPTSIADALAQVPQFKGSTRQGSGISAQFVSGAFLNLRGLGANRGLVLLDGRRTVPTTAAGIVDINMFPNPLVERVDVLTGGASAAYGADAVAGVVNFILDTDFEGFKGEVSGGISDREDGAMQRVSLAFGDSFLNDRFRIIASIDFHNADGIVSTKDRDWDRAHYNVIQNPTWPGDGRTRFLWRPGVTGTSISPGGAIIAGPLSGTQFLPGGAPAPYVFGTDRTAATQVGGDGGWIDRGNVQAPLEFETYFAHAEFDIASNFTIWGEFNYSNAETRYASTMPSLNANNVITIYDTNAYLDPVTLGRMNTAGVTSFPLSRTFYDLGYARAATLTDTTRFSIGFDLDVGGWTVDGYFDTGESNSRNENYNSPIMSRLYESIDTVISGGVPVCRSTVTNPGNGCVPYDIFGGDPVSDALRAYVIGNGWAETEITQDTAGISVRGSPFATWAGAVNIGGGVEWRDIEVTTVADPISMSTITPAPGSQGLPATLNGVVGGFNAGNFRDQPTSGYDVAEVFVEALVPLASDWGAVNSIDLNGAVRYADYSSTGGVTSWKVGLSAELFEMVRLRATRSRDVRAPNVTELYAPLQGAFTNITDPLTSVTSNTRVLTGGNANLDPELADTITYGIVFQPDWFDGFSVSLDYYSITIEDAIGSLSGQLIVNLCQTDPQYCAFVNRLPAPANSIVSIEARSLNQSSLDTSGVDFEVNLRQELGIGALRVRGLVSYLDELVTTDLFGNSLDAAGVNGGEAGGTPTWQGTLDLSYEVAAWTLHWRQRYLSGGLYSNIYNTHTTDANSIDHNHVGSATYSDLTIQYEFARNEDPIQLFFTVNNLFDADPPVAPSRVGAPTTIMQANPTLYDIMGRYYSAGIRFRF